MIGLGEVVERLGRSVADRLDRAGQIGQGFGNGNQLAVALTLHGFILPCSSDKTGVATSLGGRGGFSSAPGHEAASSSVLVGSVLVVWVTVLQQRKASDVLYI